MEVKKLQDLVERAKSQETKKIAVAASADHHVLEAVKEAYELGIVMPILVGDEKKTREIAAEINFDLSKIEVIDIADVVLASKKAVSLIREGKAEVLMKGLVATGTLLKAVLDKENGLRKGGTLSHVAFYTSPYYHKMLCVTDAAMNVAPELNDKIAILNNAVEAYHKLGVACPKVAVSAPVEVVNPKMESTIHGAILTQMNRRKQIKGCEVDGPLALDNIISKEAAAHKGIESNVAGDADIILVPEINAGNLLYKSLTFLGGSECAAVIMGAKVPIVLTSRSDSERVKLLSIALAAAMN